MNLSQFCTHSIFGNNGTYIYCVLEWNWRPCTMVGACVKNVFKSLEYVIWKMNFSAGLSLCTKACSEKFGLSTWVPYWFIDTNIQHLFYFHFIYSWLKITHLHTKKSLYSLYSNNIELIDVNSVTEQEMQSFPKEFLKSVRTS